MTGVAREAIYTPQPNELLLVRGELTGRTVEWALAISQARFAPGATPYALNLDGRIVGARFNDQIDLRIAEQKASINRLLSHLKHHCPNLLGRGGCDWKQSVG